MRKKSKTERCVFLFGKECMKRRRNSIILKKYRHLSMHIMLYVLWKQKMGKYTLDFVLRAAVEYLIYVQSE